MRYRTCQEPDCRQRFTPALEDKNIRCPPCREKRRHKVCRSAGCDQEFRDGSEKNTRRFCDACDAAKAPRQSGNKLTARLEHRRARRVRTGAGGRVDDLSSMKPFTNSWWGRVGELLYLYLYPDASDAVDEYGNKALYDCDHREHKRVNVKTAKQSKTKHGRPSWKFMLDGVQEHADQAFLIGFDTEKHHVAWGWFVPKGELPNHLKVMTPGSKEYAGAGHELPDADVALLDRKLQAILTGLKNPSPAPGDEKPKLTYDRVILGRIGEAVYGKQFPSSDHVAGRDPIATFDYCDEGGVTVNVRARRPAREREQLRWTFFRTTGCTAEVYHFYGFDEAVQKVMAAYRVPASDLPSAGFSVSFEGKSKWSEYRLNGFPCPVSEFTSVDDFEAVHLEVSGVSRSSIEKMGDGQVEALLRRAASYHRFLGFPYPSVPTDGLVASDVRRVREYIAEGKSLPQDNAALGLTSSYMPNRFRAKNVTADFSAVDAYGDDVRLLRALRFSLKGKSPGLTQNRLRGALTALNRTPTQFRPTVTKALVEHYTRPGDTVLDPCAGWGGRLVGSVVCGRRYVGVEVEKETADNLYRLGARLCDHLELGRDMFEILHDTIEEVSLGDLTADFALTSPPYAGQERYGDVEGDEFQVWSTSFLPLMFSKVRDHLKSGSRFAVVVSDVQRGRKTLPLEKTVVRVGEEQGFALEEAWTMEIGSFGGQPSGRSEPVLIFRRS